MYWVTISKSKYKVVIIRTKENRDICLISPTVFEITLIDFSKSKCAIPDTDISFLKMYQILIIYVQIINLYMEQILNNYMSMICWHIYNPNILSRTFWDLLYHKLLSSAKSKSFLERYTTGQFSLVFSVAIYIFMAFSKRLLTFSIFLLWVPRILS